MRYLTLGLLESIQWKTQKERGRFDRLRRELEIGINYPIVVHFLHNDDTVRIGFGVQDGHVYYLEVPLRWFNQLPEVNLAQDSETPPGTDA